MAVREINQAGMTLIEGFEKPPDGSEDDQGNVHPYLDPVQIWTIGWGHAISSGGRHLVGEADRALANSMYPDGLTPEQADALLRSDLMTSAAAVQQLVTTPLSDNEFAALVSFTFNVGAANLGASTLLRCLNAGDRQGAANQFGRWVLAHGQQMPGLVTRRAAERSLFLTPDA